MSDFPNKKQKTDVVVDLTGIEGNESSKGKDGDEWQEVQNIASGQKNEMIALLAKLSTDRHAAYEADGSYRYYTKIWRNEEFDREIAMGVDHRQDPLARRKKLFDAAEIKLQNLQKILVDFEIASAKQVITLEAKHLQDKRCAILNFNSKCSVFGFMLVEAKEPPYPCFEVAAAKKVVNLEAAPLPEILRGISNNFSERASAAFKRIEAKYGDGKYPPCFKCKSVMFYSPTVCSTDGCFSVLCGDCKNRVPVPCPSCKVPLGTALTLDGSVRNHRVYGSVRMP